MLLQQLSWVVSPTRCSNGLWQAKSEDASDVSAEPQDESGRNSEVGKEDFELSALQARLLLSELCSELRRETCL